MRTSRNDAVATDAWVWEMERCLLRRESSRATVMAAVTRGLSRSLVRLALDVVGSLQDLAQVDAIEAQQSSELALAQQLSTTGFGSQEAETT